MSTSQCVGSPEADLTSNRPYQSGAIVKQIEGERGLLILAFCSNWQAHGATIADSKDRSTVHWARM